MAGRKERRVLLGQLYGGGGGRAYLRKVLQVGRQYGVGVEGGKGGQGEGNERVRDVLRVRVQCGSLVVWLGLERKELKTRRLYVEVLYGALPTPQSFRVCEPHLSDYKARSPECEAEGE